MPEPKHNPVPPQLQHHHKPRMVSYPDYGKSLVAQRHPHPMQEGLQRGAQTAMTGAAIGALIARVLTDNPKAIAGTAAGMGAAAAIPGFISGRNQARSDYSNLLYLRSRLGISRPGELDALLQNPSVMQSMVDRDVKKAQAANPAMKTILKALGVVAAGGAGYALGSQGTSRLIGYHDDPAARHVGGYVNAANATAIAAVLAMRHHPQYGAKAMQALMHPGALGAMAGMEVIPSVLRSANRVAKSTEEQAQSQVSPSLARAIHSSTARGAAVGAGLAGLTSIATGLSRAKTDNEIQNRRGRAGMVAHDFGKFVGPAAVGGGVVGSLAKPQAS